MATRLITTSFFPLVAMLTLAVASQGCATGGTATVAGNERGSPPSSEHEVNEYKRAVHKCYKTGGTRVVKIEGKLRCYD